MPISITNTAQYDNSIPNTTAMLLPDGSPSLQHWGRDVGDGLLAAYQTTKATLRWTGEVRTYSPLANTGDIGVRVGFIEAIALYDGTSKWRTFTEVGPTDIDIGVATLSNDTVYYIYAYIDSGAVAFEVSTTATDTSGTANWMWKNGAYGTHRFIGCFITEDGSGSAKPIPFQAIHGRYRYAFSEISSPGADLSGSLSPWNNSFTAATTITFGPAFAQPRIPHTRAMPLHLYVYMQNNGATARYLSIDHAGTEFGGTAGLNPYTLYLPASATLAHQISFDCDSSAQIRFTPSHTDCQTWVYILGYDIPGCV